MNLKSKPNIGDSSNHWIWIAMAFVSGGTLFGTFVIKRKKESNKA